MKHLRSILFLGATFATALSAGVACSAVPTGDASTSTDPLGSCLSFGNPTGGPTQICGAFADTWRHFATGGNPNAYDANAHFAKALALFGYPVTGETSRDGDVWITFERIEMNASANAPCPYGACVSLSGKLDAKADGLPTTEGWTENCWEPGIKARPMHCLDDFGLPNLTFATTQIGSASSAIRLQYYGFPVSAPMACDWWNQHLDHSRQCVFTERTKLGYFPENQAVYQWQGEQLGLKAKRRREGAELDALDYMRNTHGGRLKGTDGSIVGYYEVPNSNKFYYVKGGANNNDGRTFERYAYDAHDVWLERDTSWPLADGGGIFGAYDCVDPTTHQYGKGSLIWAKRHETVSDVFDFRTQVIGLQTNGCRWSNGTRNSTNSGSKTIRRNSQFQLGGNIGTVDAIAVDYGACETHWYARGWGWVKWEYHGNVCANSPGADVTWNQWSSTVTTPVEPCGDAPVAFGAP
ncbi:hypothetical protein BH09MYX1_BH09MYX1_44880 [soil metagenome]